MLLVILGAGASYDSVAHLPPPAIYSPVVDDPTRPTLANQLFENRGIFVEIMTKYPECLPLIPPLRKNGVIVERELAKIQEQSKTFPRALHELAAIRFHLHHALWECERVWKQKHKGITNFAAFLREIERWRFEAKERVCFVTFNYDTMLEDAMAAASFRLKVS